MLLYQGVARCNKGGVLCKMRYVDFLCVTKVLCSALNDASVDISPTTRRQNAKCVHLRGTKKGLGIKIVGGRNVHTANKSFGVYIKEIVSGQLADTNGMYSNFIFKINVILFSKTSSYSTFNNHKLMFHYRWIMPR